jgi:hypothetical protein
LQTTLLSLAFATLGLFRVGEARQERLPRDPGPRTEYFVLEIVGGDAAAVTKTTPTVGSVVLRRRALADGYQLEAEWQFDRTEEEGGTERVLHIEQFSGAGSKLIWREWGPARARSLSVTRDAAGRELAWADSGRGAAPRGTLASKGHAWMPLEILERMRLGDAPGSACERFDPLARTIERVEVRRLPLEAAAGAAPVARAQEIVREDGTTAGRCEFVGEELRSFGWQHGDLVARRVDEAEYRARDPLGAVTIKRP